MRRVIVLALACLPMIFGASKVRDWKIGKVLDSAMGTEYINDQERTVMMNNNVVLIADANFIFYLRDTTRRGGGLLTTAMANRKHGCRFIVGGEIRYAYDKRSVYVLDADRKECKLEILRQQKRLSGAPPTTSK